MDDITRLRHLLGINDDRAVSDDLHDRVADPQHRTEDVAEVLPRALEVARKDGRLAIALKQPIEDTLQQSITDNPRSIAEVLYPVMGPAIRRSITETLSAALEGLNQGLQVGFSRQGLKWRMESWRTGVPFREVVLRHTLKYRVSEAFLIHKKNGLLIARAGVVSDDALDRDAVAAMLTAIEDFVADSTGGEGEDGELSSAELGGKSLWILQGFAARLALVIEGQPPLNLRMELQDRLAYMHEHFGSYMSDFDGSQEPLEPLTEELEQCLGYESVDDEAGKSGNPRIAIAVLGLLALALIGWAAWATWQNHLQQGRWNRLQQLVATMPGVVWLDADTDANPAQVHLLTDPLAGDITGLTATAGFKDQALVVRAHPYLSAEPEILLRRLLRAFDGLPDTVTASVHDGRLKVAGVAPAGWADRLAMFIRDNGQGIAIDDSELAGTGLANQVRGELEPPASVIIEDTGSRALRLAGTAPLQWRSLARQHLATHYADVVVDWNALAGSELPRLYEIAQQLATMALVYESDTQTSDAETAARFSSLFGEVARLTPGCNCAVQFQAMGCSDQTGTTRTNQRVRDARARAMFELLIDQGIDAEQITTDSQCTDHAVRASLVNMEVTPL